VDVAESVEDGTYVDASEVVDAVELTVSVPVVLARV